MTASCIWICSTTF